MSTLIRNGNKIGGGISELEKLQIYELPTPSSVYAGKIYQYVGVANEAFTSGFFYKCELNSNDVYEWKEIKTSSIINDTGASTDFAYSSQRVQTLLDSKANTSTTYSKIEVDSRISAQLSSALKYKGKVATIAALPVDAENGDSYIVEADDLLYAWSDTSSQWDALGGITDLTNYYTKTEVDQMLMDLAEKFQYTTMPTASSTTIGKVIQFIGADTNDYKNGYWYKGVDNGDGTYGWTVADVNELMTYGPKHLQRTHPEPILNDINNAIPSLSGTTQYWGVTPTTDHNPFNAYGTVIAIRNDTTIKQIALRNANSVMYTRSIECDSNGAYVSINEDWKQYATTDDILDNNYNGGFMAGDVAWYKTGNLFAYPTAGSFWSSTFLLSDRNGIWTGILKIADNGAGTASATITSLGGKPIGGQEFYYDETSYCLYFCGTWDRLTITQLTGAKVDLSITSTTQEEAKQHTRIVLTELATTENLTNTTLSNYQLSVGGENYAWFDLGTSTSTSNSQAFLFYEIIYGRVDGLQSKVLVSCGGTMSNGNYFKIVNLSDAPTGAAAQFKIDSDKHLWMGMQSYCYARVNVYGKWTGMGSKTTKEPAGTVIPVHTCATTDMTDPSEPGYGRIHITSVVGANATATTNYTKAKVGDLLNVVIDNGVSFVSSWWGAVSGLSALGITNIQSLEMIQGTREILGRVCENQGTIFLDLLTGFTDVQMSTTGVLDYLSTSFPLQIYCAKRVTCQIFTSTSHMIYDLYVTGYDTTWCEARRIGGSEGAEATFSFTYGDGIMTIAVTSATPGTLSSAHWTC